MEKTPKPSILMVLGPGGRDNDSRNQLFLILEAPRYAQNSKHYPKSFRTILFGNVTIGNFENVVNVRPTHFEILRLIIMFSKPLAF